MKIINSVVSWFMKKRTHQIELFKKFPHEVQQELFEGLVDVSKETEWGIKHNYQNIKTVKDFKSHQLQIIYLSQNLLIIIDQSLIVHIH